LDKDLEAFALENTLKTQQAINSKTISGFRIPVQAVFDEEASNQALIKLITY
jgi:hypothetical protein